jgi:hypothetical protein
MGVAGSGKSELARAILEQVRAVYLDNNFLADAFSPESRTDERYFERISTPSSIALRRKISASEIQSFWMPRISGRSRTRGGPSGSRSSREMQGRGCTRSGAIAGKNFCGSGWKSGGRSGINGS